MSDDTIVGNLVNVTPKSSETQRSSQNPQPAQEKQIVGLFLSLAAELRNLIYEHVFRGWVIAIRPSIRRKDSLEVDIWPDAVNPYKVVGVRIPRRDKRPTNAFALLCTCRQTYAETRLLPYSLNTILCGEMPFPSMWLADLKLQLGQVSNLQLCSYIPANLALSRTWLEILPHFSGLKRFEIYWQVRVPAWGSEEDHMSTATADEIEMARKISKATSALCDVSFHRTIIWE